MKLLFAMMGLCGCNSEWPCMCCKAPTGSFFKHKEEWLEGLPLRNLDEHLQMQQIPSDAPYACLSCKAKIKPDDVPPDASMTSDYKRRGEQRNHYGGVPERLPFTSIPLEDYILDALHLILRVVPLFFSADHSGQCQQGHDGEGCAVGIREVRRDHQRLGCLTTIHRHQEAHHVVGVVDWQRLSGDYGLVAGDPEGGNS